MSTATLTHTLSADVLRSAFTDEELEAAAEESALSYTYQTSAYNMCCS